MKAATFPILGLLVLSTLLAGCTSSNAPDPGPGQAVIRTSEGWILIEFYCDEAPITVANFRQYAEDGFYRGTIFHRIMQNFMIQGGGFTSDGIQKQTRDPIPLEYNLPNEPYTMSMARTTAPDSATSQFFISTVDNTQNLGPGPNSAGYAVFARVVDGRDTVDKIAAHPVGPNPNNPDEISDPVRPAPSIEGVDVGPDCEEAAASYGFEAGLIQDTQRDDGVWETVVSNSTDYVPVWIRNTGTRDDTILVESVQPAGWDVSFNPAEVDVDRAGAKRNGGPSDATTAYITIRYLGDDLQADTTDTRLRFTFTSSNDPNKTVELLVRPILAPPLATVTEKGDEVTIEYEGRFDDGTVFDNGTLTRTTYPNGQVFVPVVAGSGLVPGFAMGMLGMGVDETVTIRFPPELGYGNDNPPGSSYERFNGQWLTFELRLISIDA